MNEIGVEGIRWLVRAKWININNIDLCKSDQILGNNKLSDHQIIHFLLCEFKNLHKLFIGNVSAI
jgi:plasmid rolling circle replication initiator protein Rep